MAYLLCEMIFAVRKFMNIVAHHTQTTPELAAQIQHLFYKVFNDAASEDRRISYSTAI